MEGNRVITAKYPRSLVLSWDLLLTPWQRNQSLCEYNIRRSRHRVQEKIALCAGNHITTTTQPYAVNDGAIPASANADDSSEVIVVHNAGRSTNPLNTPFSEISFSQLVSDSTHSYLDFGFSDEMIPTTNQVQIAGTFWDPFFATSRFRDGSTFL